MALPSGPSLSQQVSPGSERRLEDLADIIRAYNDVTDKLQRSHESLKSEVNRLRRELASTNAQLQRSKRLSALGEMAAGIAHEIRNPLAAIQLYANMISDDLESPETCRSVALANTRRIIEAVGGLNSIVNDVLVFAREFEPRPVDILVSDLFNRALESHRPAIDSAGVTIIRNDLPARDVWIRADSNLMHQALLNLIRNAVDAMSGVDGRRELRVDVLVEDHSVMLEVSDTGPGIAGADIDRIFNPFFTTRNTGTGLGLAIVHRIVEVHGGSVTVWNDTSGDGGAVFRIILSDLVDQPCGSERVTAGHTALKDGSITGENG